MKISLKSIGSIDHDPTIYFPEEENLFGITLTLSIGPDNEIGSEYFDLFVCTPEWLSKKVWKPELIRHMLIVRKYDLDEIKDIINKCIETCTCDTWSETAQKLSRYFAWEYEDYQPLNNS
ncbi:immunity 8 family protein [Orbaceae bacterium ESL0727]|nr:immunity 8 family protein [Orbaceae bacterium ESL0727]